MFIPDLEIPSPLTYTHVDLQSSNPYTHPYLTQPLDGTTINLSTLIAAIKRTIAAHDFLTHAWDIATDGVISRKDPIADTLLDDNHVVLTKSNPDAYLHDILAGCSHLIPDCTNFYILVDADNKPSHLVLIAGLLFHDYSALFRVLRDIDSCCRLSPMPDLPSISTFDDHVANQTHLDTDNYWQSLLADFNKVPFGEPVLHPIASASVHATRSPSGISNINRGQLEYHHIRLAALNAWAVVLSHHVGSNDIIIAEVVTDAEGLAIPFSLVPRRVHFASTSTAEHQLSTQVAQDPLRAPHAWQNAKKLLSGGVYGIVEVTSEPELLLLQADRRSLSRPFDTPLYLSVTHTASGTVAFSLAFDTNAFLEQDAQYILDHLVLAFEQLLATPSLPHAEIDLMSAQELAFAKELPSIVTVNGLPPPEDPARYRYGGDLLLRQAFARPDGIAVEYEGKPVYTYAQLNNASNQFARYLTKTLSVRPGDTVFFFSHQSPFAVVAVYAMLKVGAAYFPLDIDTPPVLFRNTVEMMNSSLFLTVKALEPRLRGLCWGQTIVSVDEVATEWSTLDSSALDHQSLIGDPKTTLAYMNLTSGSTGFPKKCMISHSNLVHWIVEAAPGFGRGPETRQLQMYDFWYDGIVEEVFLTLYSGGTLCMISKAAMDASLTDAINTTRATSLTLTQTVIAELNPDAIPTLQVLNFTGEPLTQPMREKWLKHGRLMTNSFGPTETICGFALETPVRSSTINETPVGFSIGNSTRVYILYPDMKLAPIGCVGEIVVSGPSVGMGYLGEEEKTKEVYVDDPFREGFRMYRTGDFGRVNYEGRLFFIGRRDHQVSLDGYRIELGQIESVLLFAESAWLTAADIVTFRGKPRIAAFIAPRLSNGLRDMTLSLTADLKAEAVRLREFAKPRMLMMMVPTLWIPVQALPRTATGKLNRKVMKDFVRGLSPQLQDELSNFLN